MLSKKPGELLSRKRKRGETLPTPALPSAAKPAPTSVPASDTKNEGEDKPRAIRDTPPPKRSFFRRMVLDPKHVKGRAPAPATKLPHPRELPVAPEVKTPSVPPLSPAAPIAMPMPEPGVSAPIPPQPVSTSVPAPLEKKEADKENKEKPGKAATPTPTSTPTKLPAPATLPITTVQPPVAPAAGNKPAVKRAQPAWLRITIAVVVRVFIVAAILGLGYYTFQQLRETRLEGFVNLPKGYQLKKVSIVRDFRSDVFNLVEELSLTRAPIHTDIEQLQDVVSRGNADIAGREERLRLLREEIETAEKEIVSVTQEARKAGDKIWTGPGVALDGEYEKKKTDFHKIIVDRATQLKLNYNENTDILDPEVWVNAFRLSLYSVPKGVNSGAEREWAEKQLAEWKKYQEEYRGKIAALKKQIEDIQTSPQARITENNQRIAELKQRIAETEQELEPIRQELKTNLAALDKLKDDQAGLDAPFYKQVLDVPEGAVLRNLTIDPATNRFSWREINKDPQYQPAEDVPGNYYLWVRAVSPQGGEYWSFVHFSLYYYRTTQLIIQPGALLSVRKILESSAPPKGAQ